MRVAGLRLEKLPLSVKGLSDMGGGCTALFSWPAPWLCCSISIHWRQTLPMMTGKCQIMSLYCCQFVNQRKIVTYTPLNTNKYYRYTWLSERNAVWKSLSRTVCRIPFINIFSCESLSQCRVSAEWYDLVVKVLVGVIVYIWNEVACKRTHLSRSRRHTNIDRSLTCLTGRLLLWPLSNKDNGLWSWIKPPQ